MEPAKETNEPKVEKRQEFVKSKKTRSSQTHRSGDSESVGGSRQGNAGHQSGGGDRGHR